MESHARSESVRYTFLVVLLLVLLIVGKGLYAKWWIGDLGQPGWDYRPVQAVPAESPYGVYKPLPHPQHIRGAEGR